MSPSDRGAAIDVADDGSSGADTTVELDAAAPDAPSMEAADAPAGDAPIEVDARADPCAPDPDLILCLLFEGDVENRAGTNLVLSSSGVGFEAGLSGQAGRFDPQSRLEVQPSPLLDAERVTIEAWIKPRVLPTGGDRMGIVDYSREYSLFLHPNGDVICEMVTNDGPESIEMIGAVTAGQWNSLVCIYDGNDLWLGRNGFRRTSTAVDGLDPGGGADTLVLGGNFSASNPDPFDGALDNVRVWRRARTPTELCAAAHLCSTE